MIFDKILLLDFVTSFSLNIILSTTFHLLIIFVAAVTLPFLAKKPISLPPIISVELIQITEKTNIPYAPKAKKIIEEVKKKEKERVVSEQAPPKKLKKDKPDPVPLPDQKIEKIKEIEEKEQNPEKIQTETKKVLKHQLTNVLSTKKKFKKVIIAYEPVWAIGTGKTPTVEDISNTILYIKDVLAKKSNIYSDVKVLYGGSVNVNNSKLFLNNTNIDGLLVGGASLNFNSFLSMLKYQ